MTCGIYLLEFKGTDRVYVGLSKNIERRYGEHITAFKTNNHTLKLTEAYKQYGLPTLKIILECEEFELGSAEQEAIEIFNSVKDGFNSVAWSSIGGSGTYGELSASSKFSNAQIIDAFNLLYSGNLKQREISELTGVSLSIVSKIATGTKHTWLKEVYPNEYSSMLARKGNRYLGKEVLVTNGTIIEVVTNINAFARKYSISDTSVGKMVRGEYAQSNGWYLVAPNFNTV